MVEERRRTAQRQKMKNKLIIKNTIILFFIPRMSELMPQE